MSSKIYTLALYISTIDLSIMQPTNNYYGSDMSYQVESPAKKPFWRSKPAFIFYGILVLLTVGMGVVSTLKGGTSSVGKSTTLLNLIQKGDGVKSYELLSESGKTSISKEEWITQVVQLKPILTGKTPKKVYTQKLDDTRSEVAYNVGEKGSVYRITIVYESKGGLVDSIRYNKTSL